MACGVVNWSIINGLEVGSGQGKGGLTALIIVGVGIGLHYYSPSDPCHRFTLPCNNIEMVQYCANDTHVESFL